MASKKASPEPQQELDAFYKPYLSDSEESETDSDTDSSVDSQGSQDSQGSEQSVSTTSEPSVSRQNIFASNGFPVGKMSGDKMPSNETSSPVTFNQKTTKFNVSKNTTVIMINSSDRDTNVYPQPTFFTLRLPRIYRNVVGINVTQIKLLSSFYYFSRAKNNTTIRIHENGRLVTNDVYIRDGSYTSDLLVNELQNQLNMAPIYNNITFSDFIDQFFSTGDYTLLFNDPGSTTYNPLTGIFETLQSKSQIVSRYFNTNSTGGSTFYTTQQCIVAYYFPMLRDITIGSIPVVTPAPVNPYNTSCNVSQQTNSLTYDKINYYTSHISGVDYYDRILYGFQGLNDPYINLILNDPANQAILQKYKDDNTWSSFLLNNYQCSYDPTLGRLNIYTNGLNRSLVTTFNNEYRSILEKAYLRSGIDPTTVASEIINFENQNGVIISMYNFMQRAFTNNFAVNFGSFTPNFFTDISNAIFLNSAAGRYGWNLTYTGAAAQLDTSQVVYPDASGSWPNLVFNPSDMNLVGTDLYYTSSSGPIQYTYTYLPSAVDSNGYLLFQGSNERTLGYQDVPFNVSPTTYVRIPIKSRCRQTLYVETIPPYADVTGPQEQYFMDTTNTPLLFTDLSGTTNLLDSYNANFFMFDISQNMLDGADYMRQPTSYGHIYQRFMRQQKPLMIPDIIPPPGSLNIYPFRQHVFAEIHHCTYPVVTTDTMFSSDIYIENDDDSNGTTPIGVDINAYWYRDRAAFMADVQKTFDNSNWVNPKNYFIHLPISATSSGGVINTNFISGQSSYLMITTNSFSFAKAPLRIFSILRNKYGDYTIPATSDYRLLPVNLPYLSSKVTPASDPPFQYPSLFNSSGFRNWYDSTGLSNNLLDYFILTNSQSHYDPYSLVTNTTISQTALQHIFRFSTPSVVPPVDASAYSQFFYKGSTNKIIDIYTNSPYYNASVAAAEIADKTAPYAPNEFVFVNWFKAGASVNLLNPGITPCPEETIVPLPANDENRNDNPFSVFDSINYTPFSGNLNYSEYKYSPFALCKNRQSIATDISFNDLSSLVSDKLIYLGPDKISGQNNILGIMAIPFTPPLGKYISPFQIIIKFAYVQPSFDILTNTIGRKTSLGLINSQEYRYVANSNSTFYSNPAVELGQFDDHYYLNRRNVVLGVFRSIDIQGRNVGDLSLGSALFTMTLTKISQLVEYSSSKDPNRYFSRTRSPEWGTYYVYEASKVATKHWVPVTQTAVGGKETTQWAAINKAADTTGEFFTTINSSDSDDSKTYYTDVSNNSLCFIPFYPVLGPGQIGMTQDTNPGVLPFDFSNFSDWAVGSFTGLTYTTLPYLPITKGADLTENPYVFYKNGSDGAICVEDIGTGVSLGDTSTYLGSAGPLCWGYTDTGLIVSPNYRQGAPFAPTFFNIRININIKDTYYNPLTNLTAFGGASTVGACYVDTQMYIYDSGADPMSSYNDISGGWGSEKAANFLKFDDDSGYNFLSYIPRIKMDRDDNYTIQIRGYVPTVGFRSGIRICGSNWTDFGEVTLKNLCDEISDLIVNGVAILEDGSLSNDSYRIANHYTYNYARTILLFNQQFVGTRTFGQGFSNSNYGGQVITTTGFVDFLTQYSNLYNTFITSNRALSLAETQANTEMEAYITDNYGGILPDYALSRNNFTDPLSFSILFKSALKASYISAFDQWGLGWNLGFTKVDTPYTTRHVANTFIKIVDDFIYLMLDDSLNLNGVDVTNKEDLSLSRDTFGEKQKYYGKLLLNTFGSFAQTFVQSVKAFPTPLGRVDKLTFRLYDMNHQPIVNDDCEYNVVMEITEMVDQIESTSLLTLGS